MTDDVTFQRGFKAGWDEALNASEIVHGSADIQKRMQRVDASLAKQLQHSIERNSTLQKEIDHLRGTAARAQEPVAWQYRYRANGGWSGWFVLPSGSGRPQHDGVEYRPLYVSEPQAAREQAIEECAAMMQRWGDEAAEFSSSIRSKIMGNVCRNAAQAIRNLASPVSRKEEKR